MKLSTIIFACIFASFASAEPLPVQPENLAAVYTPTTYTYTYTYTYTKPTTYTYSYTYTNNSGTVKSKGDPIVGLFVLGFVIVFLCIKICGQHHGETVVVHDPLIGGHTTVVEHHGGPPMHGFPQPPHMNVVVDHHGGPPPF